MAGFECSDHVNLSGNRVDMIVETDHLNQLEEDYARLALFGMKTVREGIRWSRVEWAPYQYDWRDVIRTMQVADRFGMQIIWDVCHFGYPDDLTPLHQDFADRLAALCEAFANLLCEWAPNERPVIVPVNEVSFISWHSGEVSGTCPCYVGKGWDIKYHLMKAFIKGVERIKRVLPQALILITEPLIYVAAESDDPEIVQAAEESCEYQFQALDILVGRICPELGGKPEYLDIIGFNYYYNNQWFYETQRMLDWHIHAHEPKRRSVSQLLAAAYQRYGCPLVISETSHPKEDRPEWMDMIGQNLLDMHEQGLPLLGVCIYPIIDRPDWDNTSEWHHAGLWDNFAPAGQTPSRVLYEPYATVLQRWQEKMPAEIHRLSGKQAWPSAPDVVFLPFGAVDSREVDARENHR